MAQYKVRPKPRSTAATGAARRRPGGSRPALGGALLATLTLAATCPTAPSPSPAPVATPDSIVLADAAAPHYSLQASADRSQWVAVFADATDLTLKLARGPVTPAEAAVSSTTTIDRIDVPPGINPYFGRHAFFQHAGVEHLFYSDQELADARVTKWVFRAAASEEPWTVDLLPEAILPVAALAATEESSAQQQFSLYGVVDAPDADPSGAAVVAYGVRPDAVTDPAAAAVTGRRLIVSGVAQTQVDGVAGPLVSRYACAGRSGFAAQDDAGLLLVEDTQGPLRVTLRSHAAAAGPTALGCGSQGMLVVYTRDDAQALRTSSGPALQAHEVVAASVDSSGAVGAEIKVTLARDVSVLAVFPEPPLADSDIPALSVLFSELALDDAGEPEYRLSLVTPEDGGYGKRVLARGAQPVQDLRALRVAGELIVVFRRARELRLLRTPVGMRDDGDPQSGGSW